uniref:Probable replication factor A 73 kDa subunit n=1 Tax=Steinernema glaseri TaxID=37863 RepID=A0A1I7Z0J5_9BILA
MSWTLSKKFFETINDPALAGTAPRNPVLQLLDMREISGNTYRLQMSDGEYTWSSCSVYENLIGFCIAEKPNVPLIVRIVEYDAQVKINERGNSRLTICVRDMEILARNVPKIGNPTGLASILDQKSKAAKPTPMDIENRKPAESRPVTSSGSSSRSTVATARPTVSYGSTTSDVTPIAMITPYVSRWRICGVVTQKAKIRDIKSARGEFRVFSFTLADKNGSELRVSAFGEVAERLHQNVQEGQMYYINGSPNIVKAADKRYNSTGHDYEVTMRNDSDVTPCHDRAQVKAAPLKLNVRALNKIGSSQGQNIDVLAVVEKVDEPADITVRATGDIVKKRNVYLVDDSNTMVQMTLWGEQATEFGVGPDEHPVIGIKGIQVREYNGSFSLSAKRLAAWYASEKTKATLDRMNKFFGAGTADTFRNASQTTRLELNPECNGTEDLAAWYAREKPHASFNSISNFGGGSAANFSRDLLSIGMAAAAKVGENEDRGVYFTVVATISNVRTENIVYKACATEGCKKKVQEVDGQYRCEKCDITRDSYKYVLMMGCELADATGSYWVTIFEERARDLLKITADELGTLKETDPERFNKVIDEVRFRPFQFRIRAKTEMFNDMQSIRWSVYDVKPVPYSEYLNVLRDTLQKIDLS